MSDEDLGQTVDVDPIETEDYEEAEAAEEPDEGEDAEDGEEEDGTEEVDYEGKQYKLPKELKEALLRQRDYTQKTMEVAEQRRAAEIVKQQADQTLQFVADFQNEYFELVNADKQIAELKGLDWNGIIEQDPQLAMKLQNKLNLLINQKDELKYKIDTIQHDLSEKRAQEHARILQDGHNTLKRIIPGWNDETMRQVGEYAFSRYGEMAKTIVDPKMVEDLYYAKLGRELASKLKKPTSATPQLKPTATVKSGAAKVKVNPDKLTTEQWLKWREGELKRANKR